MTLEAHSYSIVNPTPPLTPEQLAIVQAEKTADRAALAAQMADKVLEILLMNTNLTTMATKSDVVEVVNLAKDLVVEDAAINKEDIIKEVKKPK